MHDDANPTTQARIADDGRPDSASDRRRGHITGNPRAACSRSVKTEVEPVDAASVLAKVESLRVRTWCYEGAEDIRHMGPMAEQFHDAFGLGVDDRHITNVDADGVALAAIQGLSAKVEAKADRIDDLEAETGALREENERLRERLAAVEERLATAPK